MQQQFQFLVILGFTTSIIVNWIVFSSTTYSNGFSKLIVLIFATVTIWLFYWTFFTSAGKAFASRYNKNVQKCIQQRAQDYETYYRSKNNVFNDIDDFTPTQTIFSITNKTGVAVDSRSKKVCFLSNPSGSFPCDTRQTQRLTISYRDILEAALYEDGNSITKTSRTSQVAGAIVGNVLLGGTGLIVGALTGSKKTSNTVQSLEIRMTVNNTQFPFWAIAFLQNESQKNSLTYKKASEEANKFLSLMKVLINQADE
jgi:hypothetical protein